MHTIDCHPEILLVLCHEVGDTSIDRIAPQWASSYTHSITSCSAHLANTPNLRRKLALETLLHEIFLVWCPVFLINQSVSYSSRKYAFVSLVLNGNQSRCVVNTAANWALLVT